MEWFQKTIELRSRPRGFHLVTDEIEAALSELRQFQVGIAHLFILHTSASLTVNENADSDVRADLESHFRHTVPEDAPYYRHTTEGPDDMPAHIKAVTVGPGVSIPIREGRLLLGMWQGIYYGHDYFRFPELVARGARRTLLHLDHAIGAGLLEGR